ncbi:MAG TPA: DNA-directed RNA polymerase subunit alpha C-terminal domain-containing protein, partial [Promineifilum sp.]
RSKVAVQALQHGVDPVGACVGMRGVRIQSIVRELNDEKIDVIEWDNDQRVFIAKALSPARVTHVFLEEHPEEGKTAVVIVPDDQLSLAIGREGQNARLAAKLTGWRIDIKNLTEAAAESLEHLDHPAVDPRIAKDETLLNQVRTILDKKQIGRPVTAEDYLTLDRFVAAVEGRIIGERAQQYEVVRKERAELRKRVPDEAWQQPLDVLDFPGRIHNLLLDANVNTVGDLMYVLEMGDDYFLKLRGLGEKALDTVKETLAAYQLAQISAIAEADAAAVAALEEDEDRGPMVEEVPLVERVVDDEEMETAVPDLDFTEAETEPAFEDEDVDEDELIAGALEPEEVVPEAEDALTLIDDLSQTIFVEEPKPVKAETPKKKGVVVVRPTTEEQATEDDSKRKKRKSQPLVYDEQLDQVVVKRKRKSGKQADVWETDDTDY